MSPLRAEAPEFVPSSYQQSWMEDYSEEHITEQELEELEAAEAWVEAMCQLDEEEADHLVMLALKYDSSKVAEVQKQFGSKASGKKNKHKKH